MFLKMTKDMTFHLYSCTTIKKMLLEMGKEIDIICGFSIYRCFHSNILTVGVVNFVLLYVQIQKSLFFALTFFSSASSVFRKRPELCQVVLVNKNKCPPTVKWIGVAKIA